MKKFIVKITDGINNLSRDDAIEAVSIVHMVNLYCDRANIQYSLRTVEVALQQYTLTKPALKDALVIVEAN